MKRKLYKLIFILFAILVVGCENSLQPTCNLVGEYEMSTTLIAIYEDRQEIMEKKLVSPVEIYREGMYIYVATNNFGYPNTEGETFTPLVEDYRISAKHIIGKEPKKTGIEEIEIPNDKAIILIKNGLVYTYRGNSAVRSNPIKAAYYNTQKISFKKSKTFTIPIVNATGEHYMDGLFHFEYDPIHQLGDSIVWDVNLVFENPLEDGFEGTKYQNVLIKK